MNNTNCQDFRNRVEAWLDGDLKMSIAEAQSQHEQACPSCFAFMEQEKKLRQALKNLPSTDIRQGFIAEALRVARAADRAGENPVSGGSGWMMALSSAALASSCFAIGLWVWQASAGRSDPSTASLSHQTVVSIAATRPQLQTVSLSVGKVESMRLRIDAPRDFAEINFSLDLPDHVELAGQPGIRSITWKGQLSKGENVLDLPLLAASGASGVLAARISWGQFERRLEANVVGVGEPAKASPLRRI